MAIGLGLMLGFVFPKNFDSPYLAQSITEFWRRWHISLSHLAAGLPLHPARRQPEGRGAHLRQPGHRDAARRPVARRGLELRRLGRHPRRLAGRGSARMGKRPLYAFLSGACGRRSTFVVVLVAWVFFRADDLQHAIRYLGSMAGLGRSGCRESPDPPLARHPYYVGTFLVAARGHLVRARRPGTGRGA